MHAAYRLALLYCDEGRWAEAASCLEYGGESPVPRHFLDEAVLGLAGRARVAGHRGSLAEAVALARRGVELAEQSDLLNLRARAWLALAEVQRRQGTSAETDRAVAAALRLYQAKGNVAAAARIDGMRAHESAPA
jgi:tetratricopeptide (TPR) repeat protein